MSDSIPLYTKSEQVANRLTHGMGILFSITGLVLMITKTVHNENVLYIVSCIIFGLSLILLYTSSTLYHTLESESRKVIFRKLDHASIFVLIAGTYTPILLISLNGYFGWILFGLIWILALVGIILKICGRMNSRAISVVFYLAMGWLCVIAGNTLLDTLPRNSLIFIAAGGLSYTIGVIFYVWKRLVFNHAIWHIFVLSGSILHFFAIWHLLLP